MRREKEKTVITLSTIKIVTETYPIGKISRLPAHLRIVSRFQLPFLEEEIKLNVLGADHVDQRGNTTKKSLPNNLRQEIE